MKHKQILGSILACTLVISSGILVGCSAGKEKTIAVICKSENSYWDVVKNGVDGADKESEKYKAIYKAPKIENADEQKQMIKEVIDDGVDAIAIAPVDGTVFDELKDVDIPVVTIDTQSGVEGVPYIGTDNNIAGMLAGENTLSLIDDKFGDDKGKIAIVRLSENSTNTNQRAEGFINNLKHSGKDNIEILDNNYCDAEQEKAKEITMSLIRENKDLKIVYAVNQTSTLGVCDAIKELIDNNEIKVGDVTAVGFDSSDAEIEYLNNDILYGFVIQNPYNMGYEGFKNAIKLIEDKPIDMSIDTKSYFVSKDNIKNEDIQKLLNPLN